MKKLKKIVSLVIAMIMVVSAFSGCGTKRLILMMTHLSTLPEVRG